MPKKKRWPPKVYPHPASGQDRVRIGGKDFYLGPIGSEQSRKEYLRIVGEVEAAGQAAGTPRPGPGKPTAVFVCEYLQHAKDKYDKVQYTRIDLALRPVMEMYGHVPIGEFGMRALETVQNGWIDKGHSRRYCNHLLSCVKGCWKWLARRELIPVSLHQALLLVDGLRKGHSRVKEMEEVGPADPADVEKTLPHVLPVVADMIRMQLYTGMRPGETIQMRPCDVDRQGEVIDGVSIWVYRPEKHKTQNLGHLREILIGPLGQAVLTPYLDRPAEKYCFSPREGVEQWMQERGRDFNAGEGTRRPGVKYRVQSYGRAVKKGCLRAGVRAWHPHQLRHLMGTRVGGQVGLEQSRAVLGHRSINTTLIYSHLDRKLAAAIIAKIG